MKNTTIAYIAVTLFLSALLASALCAQNTPTLNGGKKWRIGYYEGGPYSDYTDTMRTLVSGLIELGWIAGEKVPDLHEEMPKPYVDWLIHNPGVYLSFRPENCYSANWDDDRRQEIRQALLKKLRHRELDLVIAMGTWAGLDLANDSHSVPVMVLSTSDPVRAGIVKSADHSGFDHVTARVDPNRYLRQLRMFHRLAGFNTLGVAYENTSDGRVYSAIDAVEQVARERGFNTMLCEVMDTTTDTAASDRSCLDCYQKLAEQADAVYVTALTCADRRETEISDIFSRAGTPSFAMVGSKLVRKGILLSISSDSGYKALGRYNADKLGKILNGIPPGTLNQVFEDPLDIAVNVKTAERIRFTIPKGILKIAAEVYGD